MRVAVISDVHANWQALHMVLLDAKRNGVEAIWCLGDIVGRGPQPYRCWQELAEFRQVQMSGWIAGNHDWGLLGRLESMWFVHSLDGQNSRQVLAGDFGRQAWDVILQHRQVLEHKTALRRWFENLPLLASPLAGVYLAHGIMDLDPMLMIGTYAWVPDWAEKSLITLRSVWPALSNMEDPHLASLPRLAEAGWAVPKLMLVGHTHVVCAWQPRNGDHDGSRWTDFSPQLDAGRVWFEDLEHRPIFANPGSVGFPVDCRADLATYLLLDWEEQRIGLWLRRVPYDPTETVKAMKAAGTSDMIFRRLEAAIQSKGLSEIRGGIE